jgi:hypothetical protein
MFILVLSRIITPELWLGLALDAVTPRVFWSSTGFVLAPSDTTTPTDSRALAASATSSFQKCHHRLGHSCGSCLFSLVHRGLLEPASGDVLLHNKLSYLIPLTTQRILVT